jgi:transketolase
LVKEKNPNKFLNCGIAEANMMGVAAGLALNGLRPIVYTITPFTTTRCFEQIRVDVCYHKAPVVIVGTGSGLSYAELGATHHSLEDLAILRTLPDLQVIAPCDANELRQLLAQSIESGIPSYIRIGKKGEPTIHENEVILGKAVEITKGDDVLIFFTGTIASEVLKAQNLLSSEGISCQVVSMHTVKPLDNGYLAKVLAESRHRLIVTVEEHGKIGGLGGAISEFLSGLPKHPCHVRIGAVDAFLHEMGTQEYAQRIYEIDAMSISRIVKEKLNLQ